MLGDSGGQGRLAYCSSWGFRVRSDSATEHHPPIIIRNPHGTITSV